VYNSVSKTLATDLERTQNFAARCILKESTVINYHPSTETTVMKLEGLPHCYHGACVYGLAPVSTLRNMVDSNHTLRGFKNIFVSRPKTNWYKNTSRYRGAMTWNALPDDRAKTL